MKSRHVRATIVFYRLHMLLAKARIKRERTDVFLESFLHVTSSREFKSCHALNEMMVLSIALGKTSPFQ